jgi:hypothetical protein
VNPVNDYFTRFDYAWDYYDAPAKQLKQWLDPLGTGTMTLDGYDPPGNSVTNTAAKTGFKIWPNPAGDLLQFETGEAAGPEMAELSVFHISGTLLLQVHAPRSGPYSLDVSQLGLGIYILQVRIDKESARQLFIIAR